MSWLRCAPTAALVLGLSSALADVRVDPPIDFGETVWASVYAHKRDLPKAFLDAGLYAVETNASDDSYSAVQFGKLPAGRGVISSLPVDTSTWPSGDYALTVNGLFRQADGQEVRRYRAVAFGVRREQTREPRPSSSASDASVIPLVRGFSGDPKGASSVDIPWQKGFARIGGGDEVRPTLFKAFHDNDWLYVAVACSEPELMEMVRKTPQHRHDAHAIYVAPCVEINIDPSGTGLSFYKVAVSCRGDVVDCFCEDDNMGTRTFTYDSRHESGAVARALSEKASWGVEVAIPIGPLVAQGSADKWGFSIARNRPFPDRSKAPEASAWPAGLHGFNRPDEFARVSLQNFRKDAHAFELALGTAKVTRGKDGLDVAVTATVANRTDDFRALRLKATLKDANGNVLADTVSALEPCRRNLRTPYALALSGLSPIRGVLCVEAIAADGRLERFLAQELNVDYSPVRIVLDEPGYHDAFFATMPASRVAGAVVLEENVGRPLAITLDGPETHEVRQIACAQATNRFEFPFHDKPKGSYVLRAGGVEKMFRNLPFQEGEIWLDKDGIAYRNGKKFVPYGFFSDYFNERYEGLTVAQTYCNWMTNVTELADWCAKGEKTGRVLIIPIQQKFGTDGKDVFTPASMQGRLTDPQRAVLRQLAEAARKEPWFGFYYMYDEPSGRDLNPEWFKDVRAFLCEIDPYHPTIILDYSLVGNVRYAEGADISCPDAYPVYCSDGTTRDPRRLTYDFARAAGHSHAAWMCPQYFDWDVFGRGKRTCGPTYDDLRMQTMLSFIGDVRGFVCWSRWSFCAALNKHLELGPRRIIEEIRAASDLFLANSRMIKVVSSGPDRTFLAAEKEFDGRRLLIACNTADEPVEVAFEGVRLTRAFASGVGSAIVPASGRFSDRFGANEARVYYEQPGGFDLSAARAEVYAAEAARHASGNLAAAKRLLVVGEIRQMKKDGIPDDWYPRFVASSFAPSRCGGKEYMPYFLQDGMKGGRLTTPYLAWMADPARRQDRPWVRLEFGRKTKFSRIVLFRAIGDDGLATMASGSVKVNGETVATFDDPDREVIELTIPETEAESVTLEPGKVTWDGFRRWLTEFEVYER